MAKAQIRGSLAGPVWQLMRALADWQTDGSKLQAPVSAAPLMRRLNKACSNGAHWQQRHEEQSACDDHDNRVGADSIAGSSTAQLLKTSTASKRPTIAAPALNSASTPVSYAEQAAHDPSAARYQPSAKAETPGEKCV